MKKPLLLTILFAFIIARLFAQSVNLSGIYDTQIAAVTLSWNMAKSPYKTSYILLRSNDGVSWTEVVKDRMLRNYAPDDIYTFYDKKFFAGKNYYRLRISDGGNNIVALSSVIEVNTAFINTTPVNRAITPSVDKNPVPNNSVQKKNDSAPVTRQNSQTQNTLSNNYWVIYPNPATDFLYLNYKGSENLKGVVNVSIEDGSGKTVIKFRSGSMYKSAQIPISGLTRGVYFIQVIVLDKLMMNQRFIKQ